jgi:L1 cell adhesion molecule like protein
MRNTIEDPKFKDLIKDDDRKKVEQAIKDIQSWLDQNHNASGEEFDSKRKELEQIWTPIITAAYQSGGGDAQGMGGMPNMGNFNQGGGASNDNAGPKIDEVD